MSSWESVLKYMRRRKRGPIPQDLGQPPFFFPHFANQSRGYPFVVQTGGSKLTPSRYVPGEADRQLFAAWAKYSCPYCARPAGPSWVAPAWNYRLIEDLRNGYAPLLHGRLLQKSNAGPPALFFRGRKCSLNSWARGAPHGTKSAARSHRLFLARRARQKSLATAYRTRRVSSTTASITGDSWILVANCFKGGTTARRGAHREVNRKVGTAACR